MSTDRAAESEAGDVKVNMPPAPCPTLRPRSLGRIGQPSVTSPPLIMTIHSTLTDLLVRQASLLTTGDEQNQFWQGRNELQARRV